MPSHSVHHSTSPGRLGVLRRLTILIAVVGCCLSVGITGVGTAAAAPGPVDVGCAPVSVPVAVGALTGTVRATLCHAVNGRTAPLEILVPGATYNRDYWNGEGIPAASYTTVATHKGFATVAIDRLGTGTSTHPVSAALTGAVEAAAIHQVIDAARAGLLDNVHYGQITLVGHSLGSLESVIEAATYHDVAAVMLTGYTHSISTPVLLETFATALHPAMFDGFHTDAGYLTTVAGTRAGLFDAPGEVDPAVVAADEAHKDVASATEIADGVAEGLDPALSRQIDVPVLEVDGAADRIFCGTLTRGCPSAAALYSGESRDFGGRFATLVDAQAGHDVALTRDGGEVAAAMQNWLTSTLAGHLHAGPIASVDR